MKKLLLSIILIFSLISNIYASSKDELIIKTIAQLSATSLYEMNYDRLTNIMKPFIEDKKIIAIDVIDGISNESIFLAYKNMSTSIYDEVIPQNIKDNYFKKEQKIWYEDEFVGTIIIYYYDDSKMIKLTKQERDLISKLPPLLYSEINWEPMSIINNGKMYGIMGDYLDLISEKTGVTFRYIASQTWGEVLDKFKEKKIDIIPGVVDIESETNLGLVTDSYSQYYLAIVAKKPFDRNIKLDYYNGKTLAIPEHYTSCNYIKENYPDIKVIRTKTIEEAFKLVSFSQADASVEQLSVAQHYIDSLHLTNLSIVSTTEFKFKHKILLQSDKPWLQELFNKAIQSIDAKEDREIAARWIKSNVAKREKIKLSKEEKQWIKEHPVVTYTGDPDWLPFEATDQYGNHIGIASDYVKEIADLTGINSNISLQNLG